MTATFDHALSRREALRRAGLLALGTGMPFSFSACSEPGPAAWLPAMLDPISAPGYGTDPDLVHPASAPWPNTLTEPQRRLVGTLVDILLPADGELPSASQLGVVEVIDEWISAPYPDQRQDRALLLAGFDWCDRESLNRFGKPFPEVTAREQLALIDDIAYPDRPGPAVLEGPRQFFDRLRRLTTGAYYTSPEGAKELGYEGDTPIAGDYPGPTAEAMAHLEATLRQLGLSL